MSFCQFFLWSIKFSTKITFFSRKFFLKLSRKSLVYEGSSFRLLGGYFCHIWGLSLCYDRCKFDYSDSTPLARLMGLKYLSLTPEWGFLKNKQYLHLRGFQGMQKSCSWVLHWDSIDRIHAGLCTIWLNIAERFRGHSDTQAWHVDLSEQPPGIFLKLHFSVLMFLQQTQFNRIHFVIKLPSDPAQLSPRQHYATLKLEHPETKR